ncbi:hypothetical protein FJM67_08890 [Maribrevibacterium harenarium]|uniref:Anti sigma-E protein RseA N-terminal domain-containing protein n=1 Tax=Maribrevibacterium harenarium TaxID=2589817 RepID=A0A501WPY2_9GAMM|nr:hypothetical protein [Maribrevibacterium harenarium]TPE51843.1 hypothetical protein FJM67_08890 [Maribrevibacterium harenarium]
MSQQHHTLDERALESLSALLDDEASSADIDRLLQQDIQVLAEQTDAFVMTGEAQRTQLSQPLCSQDFLAGIHNRLANQADADFPVVDNVTPLIRVPQPKRGQKAAWWGMGVAASLALAVLVGIQFQAQNTSLPLATASLNTSFTTLPERDNLRLQRYLQQHAQHASLTGGQGMMPMARVVNLPVDQ